MFSENIALCFFRHSKFPFNFQITLRHTDKLSADFETSATGGARRRQPGAPSQAMPTFDVEESSGLGSGRSENGVNNPLANDGGAGGGGGGSAPTSVVEI